MIRKDDPKIIRSWAMYDWANSSYALIIITAIFPIYYAHQVSGDVTVFGLTIDANSLFTYIYSTAYLLVAVLIPLLSGIADYGGMKKRFMRMFTIIGSVSCATLYFFDKGESLAADGWVLKLGIFATIFACVGYNGSLVFYNSFLPEIASTENQDKVSAKGFATGYFGSMLLLAAILAVNTFKADLGIDPKTNVFKWSFVGVGLWWFLFSIYPLKKLPDNVFGKKVDGDFLKRGYREIRKVFGELKHNPTLKKYLRAFFVFGMGIQTMMVVAVMYANDPRIIQFKDDAQRQSTLIGSILIIQLVGIAGSHLFARFAKMWGNINALQIGLLLYSAVCAIAFFITTPMHFYIVAVLVGIGMGGIQALARSTYSKLLPETEDHASYFSFYDVAEKVGIVFGTFVFGFINELMDNLRYSVLSLTVFFLVGYFLLFALKSRKAVQAA